jgi:hypothetical protein
MALPEQLKPDTFVNDDENDELPLIRAEPLILLPDEHAPAEPELSAA